MIEPDTSRAAAQEILSRPEFSEPEPGVVRRVLDWIGDQLARLFDFLPATGGGGSVPAALAWVLLIAVVGYLLWLVVRGGPWSRRRRSDRTDAPRAAIVAGRSAAQWDEAADDAERTGQWSAAVRARYRGVVARLADRRIVVERAGSTSGEHRDGVARRWHAGEAPFRAGADRFDEVWYGGVDAGPDDARRLRELAARAQDAELDAEPSRG